MSRLDDLVQFYSLLDRLEQRVGGKRRLADFELYRYWPQRGVYFFFEPSENRTDSGSGPRAVRVGTHGLNAGSRSTLAQRLGNHRGTKGGGGNHRGSIFRLLVGQALMARGGAGHCRSWGVKSDASKAAKALGCDRTTLAAGERPIEEAVSSYVGAMSFLWLEVSDEPSPDSQRGFIERNAIALLSNFEREPLDRASVRWLGRNSDRPLVRSSGLWNQRHVTEAHDPGFLDTLRRLVENTQGR